MRFDLYPQVAGVDGTERIMVAKAGTTQSMTVADINGAATSTSAAALARVNPIKLQAFGFVGDGVTDDAPAFNALIAGTTGDLHIKLPPGRIYLASTITTPGTRSITIEGCGSQVTCITWGPGVAIGWNHGQAAPGVGTFHIRGVRLINTTTKTGTALRVSTAAGTNPVAPAFAMNDVRIGDAGTAPVTWHQGVCLYGCWNSQINNSYIFLGAYTADLTATGVIYSEAEIATSAFPNKVTTVLTCNNLFIQGGFTGISLLGGVQGINLVNCNISGTAYGVDWSAAPTGVAGTLQISNSQMACAVRHVRTLNADNPMILGNTFIQFDQFNATYAAIWACLEFINSPLPIVVGNYILNPGGNVLSSKPVIYCRDTTSTGYQPGRIASNVLYTQNAVPVQLEGTVSATSVTNNDFFNHGPGFPAAGLVAQVAAPAWAASTTYAAGSAVTNGGNTYTTVAGGVSAGSGGPSGMGASTDGTVTWAYVCPSLATAPNAVSGNTFYGAGSLTEDSGGNVAVGPTVANALLTLRGSVISTHGMDFGTPNFDGYLDLHGRNTVGNDYDVRLIATGGTTGTNGVGIATMTAASFAINAKIIQTTLAVGPTYANDAAAATGGVAVGEFYRNGSVVQIRAS